MANIVQADYGHSGTDATASLGAVESTNQLIVFAQSDQASTNFVVSDNQGNTYTELLYSTTAPAIRILRCVSPAASSLTVTANSEGSFTGVTVIEIQGASTGALDVAAVFSTGSGANSTTPDVSPSQAGFALAFMARQAAGTIAPAADWTEVREDESWTNVSGASASKVVAAGSTSHTWTLGGASANKTAILVLAESSGGGGGGGSMLRVPRVSLMGVGRL